MSNMNDILKMILSAINNGESDVHDFVATEDDGVVTVVDNNELALPVQLVVSGDLSAISARVAIAPISIVPEDVRGQFAWDMLSINPTINLSDVGIANGNFIVSGSLSSDSKESVLFQEVETLVFNANEFAGSLQKGYMS